MCFHSFCVLTAHTWGWPAAQPTHPSYNMVITHASSCLAFHASVSLAIGTRLHLQHERMWRGTQNTVSSAYATSYPNSAHIFHVSSNFLQIIPLYTGRKVSPEVLLWLPFSLFKRKKHNKLCLQLRKYLKRLVWLSKYVNRNNCLIYFQQI